MRAVDSYFAVKSPVPGDAWESLFRVNRHLMASQSPAWRDAVVGCGKYKDVSLLYEFASGHQVLLPMARRAGHVPWALATSWPRPWGVGGPISVPGEVDATEAVAVLRHAVRRQAAGTEIHLSAFADPIWLRAATAAGEFDIRKEECYVLDLTGGPGEVWSHRFRHKIRTAVRKAERSGLDVEVDRSGKLLGVFYDLYVKSIERWAVTMREPLWFAKWHMTRRTPRSMLDLMARSFGEACATWVARADGEPIAAIIVLTGGSCAQGWLAAMDKVRAAARNPNELLHWLAIQDACRNGCEFYDMGDAQVGSPVARFKEGMGAELRLTHYLRAERLPIQKSVRVGKEAARRFITLRYK